MSKVKTISHKDTYMIHGRTFDRVLEAESFERMYRIFEKYNQKDLEGIFADISFRDTITVRDCMFLKEELIYKIYTRSAILYKKDNLLNIFEILRGCE